MFLLVLASGYVLTSVLLLKFPLFYRRKKHEFIRCQHISHRGGAGENLENTMSAFRHAVKNTRTDMLEIDCHLSKDGQVVVAHDGLLLRTCGSPHRIAETNYGDLPYMQNILPLDFGKHIKCRCANDDRRIPLLREVFEEFPSVPINIDIKEDNDELIEKVHDLIKEFDREHLTVWGNFRDVVTQKCYNMNPNISIFFTIRRVMITLALFYTGLLPYFPIKERFFEICMPRIFLRGDTNFVLARRHHRWTFWIFDKLLMNSLLFEHLNKRGVQVYIWVLNNEADFKRAYDVGANGVMTDFPTKLRSFLDNGEVLMKNGHATK